MIIKIECNRSIKKLNIEFGDDGDSQEIEFEESDYEGHFPGKSNSVKSKPKKNEKLLDLTDEDIPEIVQEVIEKPQIEEKERTPMVAGEMQNLEF